MLKTNALRKHLSIASYELDRMVFYWYLIVINRKMISLSNVIVNYVHTWF